MDYVVRLKANIDQSYFQMIAATEEGALARTFRAVRTSVQERLAAGKALRARVPRCVHATYEPTANRPDPISILLLATNKPATSKAAAMSAVPPFADSSRTSR
jgi:hypothetical protein